MQKHQKIFFSDLRTAIPLAFAIPVFFYFNPTLSNEVAFVFFAFWSVCFALDVKSTIKANVDIQKFEKNFVFPILYERFGKSASIIIQLCIEIGIIFVLTVIFLHRFSITSSSFIALIFGIAHILAFISNAKFSRK